MSDTISRQAAIDAIHCDITITGRQNAELVAATIGAFADRIKALPSAEPQIIRCKNCKHWIPYDWMFNEVWQSKNIADYPEDDIGCDCSDMAMKANDFCSRGERRENG